MSTKVNQAMVLWDSHDVHTSISRMITAEKWQVVGGSVRTGQEAIDLLKAHRPQFAIIDHNLRFPDGFEVALVARELGIQFVIVVPPLDTPATIKAMRAGAVDAPSYPFKQSELAEWLNASLAVSTRQVRGADGQLVTARAGLIYSFYPVEPGSGASVVVSNMATRLLRIYSRRQPRVIIVDLDLACGKIAELFGHGPRAKQTFKDGHLVSGVNVLSIKQFEDPPWTWERIQPYVIHDERTGVDLIGSPRSKFERAGLESEDVEHLLKILEVQYDVTCVDLASESIELAIAMAGVSDCTNLVVEPAISGFDAARTMLEYLRSCEVPAERLRVILNKATSPLPNGLMLREIDEQCFKPYKVQLLPPIPFDHSVMEAANRGEPLEHKVESPHPLRQAITRIWEYTMGVHFPSPEQVKDKTAWSAFRTFFVGAKSTLSGLTPPPLPRPWDQRTLESE